MSKKIVLEHGDQLHLKNSYGFSRQKVMQILADPESNKEDYMDILSYLDFKEKRVSVFENNKELFLDIYRTSNNIVSAYNRRDSNKFSFMNKIEKNIEKFKELIQQYDETNS